LYNFCHSPKKLATVSPFSNAISQKKIWCLPGSYQIFVITGAQWSGGGKFFSFFSKMTYLTPELDTTPQKLA
jgi:hypothetical protein